MLVPAIHFPGGTCTEAITFYQKVFNATVINVTYAQDAPLDYQNETSVTDETRNRVIHAELIISGTRVNMADGAEELIPGNRFLFNIFLESVDEVSNVFHQLKEGGEILTELGPQFWTPLYGEVKDRFGVWWQLMANQ